MKVKIKKVSVPHLTSLMRKMLLMDSALYINVDKDRIWSSVYTETQDVVKTYSLPVKDVFEFESPLKDTIKLSFFSGSRILNCIGFFDPHHLSMEISTFKDNDENVYYADKIILRDQKLKIEAQCQDIVLGFTSMTNDQVKRAFDESTKVFNFTLSKFFLSVAILLKIFFAALELFSLE